MVEPRQVKRTFSFKQGTTTYAFLLAYAKQAHGGNASEALSYIIEQFRASDAGRMVSRKIAKEGTAQTT